MRTRKLKKPAKKERTKERKKKRTTKTKEGNTKRGGREKTFADIGQAADLQEALLQGLHRRVGRELVPREGTSGIYISICPCNFSRLGTVPPTKLEVQKGPFQEESSLCTGVCALPC